MKSIFHWAQPGTNSTCSPFRKLRRHAGLGLLGGGLLLAMSQTTALGFQFRQPVQREVQADFSADGVWNALPEDAVFPAGTTGFQTGQPDRFRLYRLDGSALETILRRAPIEFSRAAAENQTILSLPMPDGSFGRFRIEESPIFEAELGAMFPDIKTYRGQGIDDPTASVRFEQTRWGFGAQIISDRGTALVDATDRQAPEYYMSYWKKDVPGEGFRCSVDEHFGEDPFFPDDSGISPQTFNPSGTQLTTYRLAVTATGEYTQFFGGSAAALTQIAITTNRVTGIYEREVAISFVLVANESNLIYTDPTTDPFGSGASIDGTLLGENQTTIDSVIGSANYDIGHIFSQGGSGGYAPGRVCNAANKAQGGTSLANPSGDVFDVDFVAHEMGHQFDGRHTWNGTSGSCSAGQFTASSAYEPGSGSTIMAYAGICSGQNVQPHSDPYFHVHSFDQITARRDGAGCGTVTATGNVVPTVNAGPDYTIPRSTPFALTALGTAGDSDTLTYNWEQFDLGTRDGLPMSTFTSGPVFRSRLATTDSSRTLPRWEDILSGAATPWEVLPSVDRTLNFRATVRDNRANGGGVSWDAMQVTVSGAPFQVTSPSAGDNLECGDSDTLTWNVGGGSVASNVRASFSSDGGTSFSGLVGSTANDGSASYTVPQVLTATGRVLLEPTDNIFFAVSGSFSIVDTMPPLLMVSGNIVAECTSPTGTPVAIPPATASDACDGSVVPGHNAPALFDLGDTVVTWQATDDSGNSAMASQTVSVVDTVPPVITAPPDLTVECTSSMGTPVDIGMPTVSDVCDDDVVVSHDAPAVFPLGDTIVTWKAVDHSGNTAQVQQTITVQDTTPPELELSVTPEILWPPKHQMVEISALIVVTDICDASPSVQLVSITSNEPDDDLGDGSFINDIQNAAFGTDDREFSLRAERQGVAEGRIYTIIYEATDASGNSTMKSATVAVPFSRSRRIP